MADPVSPSEVLDWANRIGAFISGVVATILGMTSWLVPKFRGINTRFQAVEANIEADEKKAHHENDQLAAEFHNRITVMEKLIVELGAVQKGHIETYRGLRDDLQVLSGKTDEQTAVLNQVVGELRAMHQRRDS